MTWLHIKSLLIRTPFEEPAQRLRELAGIVTRLRTPELSEIHAEQGRIGEVLRQIIKPDANCIDIGCHIGSSLSLMLSYSPRGKHIAFEPISEKAAWLRRKFPEVEIHELALGSKCERLTFFKNVSHPGFSGFAKSHGSADTIVEQTVNCETLDNVAGSDQKYAFIKIDVEGAELLVLRGARELIARDAPCILFESSHDGAANLGLKREDLYTFFVDELRYSVFLLSDYLNKRTPLDLAGFQEAAVYPFQAFNFLAVPHSTNT